MYNPNEFNLSTKEITDRIAKKESYKPFISKSFPAQNVIERHFLYGKMVDLVEDLRSFVYLQKDSNNQLIDCIFDDFVFDGMLSYYDSAFNKEFETCYIQLHSPSLYCQIRNYITESFVGIHKRHDIQKITISGHTYGGAIGAIAALDIAEQLEELSIKV